MTTLIHLPGSSDKPPVDIPCSKRFTDQNAPLEAAVKQLADAGEVSVVVGTDATPANWWLAAQLTYPEADQLIWQQSGLWLKISNQTVQPLTQPTAPGVSAQTVFESSDSPTAPNRPVTSDSHQGNRPNKAASHQSHDLVWETFKLFIFKQSNAKARLTQHLQEAEARQPGEPELIREVKQAAQQGKHAAHLADSLQSKLDRGESPEDVRIWKDKVSKSQPHRVVKHLNVEFDKAIKFRQRKKYLWKKNRDFRITLPYTPIENGVHPQSFRGLSPASCWEIYIDESGSVFNDQAQTRNETDTELGRVVALALPNNHQLKPLPAGTHATELTHEKIQKLLRSLCNNSIGVLGATVKQDLLSHNWLAAIRKLIRWAVMMLPIDGPTQVRFKIENRGNYNNSKTLMALEEALIDEVRQLAPERFEKLQLSLEIVGKDAPFNGYCDVIANCWASSDSTKRQLLARTGWKGHCLLQSTDMAEIDRLYQDAAGEPDADAWFDLCHHVAREPGHSLLHDLLAQIGLKARGNSDIWQYYLDGVRRRIAFKHFDAGSLGRALSWLKLYQPDHNTLPGLLELQLASVQLAANNHQGHSNLEQVSRVMALSEELRDEVAPDACEAALRVAISATNSFDFESAVPYIENWLAQPVAVPGRLNYGKLQSTLGQLAAFRGQYSEAIDYFDAALEQFEKLSDPAQAGRNRQQTASYRAITLLDMDDSGAADAVRNLIHQATRRTGTQAIRQLARSGSTLRFEHYLLLRWLIASPHETACKQEYLACIDDWQMGEGHPWMLINGYRAWLLSSANHPQQAANYLSQAIEDCCESEDSAILHWMAHCLHALGVSIGLDVQTPERSCPTAPFPSEQLARLNNATTDTDRMSAFSNLLPFNFH